MISSATALPLGAGVLGAVFAAFVWRAWFSKRREDQLAWALGLTAYAFVALVEAYVSAKGWTILLYRAYFALAAGNVGLLGLGTVLLLRSELTGRIFSFIIVGALSFAAVSQFGVTLTLDTPVTSEGKTQPLSAWGTDLGGKAIPFPNAARFAFLILNVVGGLALIGGALWSWWQTRAAGVLLIGVGALFPFLGGTLSSLGLVHARVVTQFVGIGIMFVGYLAGSAAARARPAASTAVPP